MSKYHPIEELLAELTDINDLIEACKQELSFLNIKKDKLEREITMKTITDHVRREFFDRDCTDNG